MSAQTEPFDEIMASLDTRMIVVTSAVAGERAGCLVGFHAQSSIDPRRYTIWLSKANHTYRVASRATHVAVHFLSSSDTELAAHFGTLTGDAVDKFAGLDVTVGPGSVPLLSVCPNRFVARRVALLDEGGDHVCVVVEPVDVHSAGPFTPLTFSQVKQVDPGHGTEERPEPPTERAADRR